jgi:hypothetical protein
MHVGSPYTATHWCPNGRNPIPVRAALRLSHGDALGQPIRPHDDTIGIANGSALLDTHHHHT